MIDDSAFGATPLPDVHDETCSWDGAAEVCTPLRGGICPADDPAWAFFNLIPPAAAPDAQTSSAAERAAWEAATDARLAELQAAIDLHNQRFERQQIKSWTQYLGQRSVYETVVTRTDPGQISAGGDLQITGGTVVNDKSHLLAGGRLHATVADFEQTDATGIRRIRESGTSQYSKSRWRGGFRRYHERDWGPRLPYVPADAVTAIVLPVARTQEQVSAAMAEQQQWQEGGSLHVALHAIVGGLAADLAGAVGAATVAASAPQLNALQAGLEARLIAAGVDPQAASATASGRSATAAAMLGATVGADAGAGMGLAVDANNRQLHASEIRWLREQARTFASAQKISERDALERLSRQAVRQVDLLWRAQLPDGDDAAAKAFLANSTTTFINELGKPQAMFTAEGTQLLRPEMFVHIADQPFYRQFVATGVARELNTALLKEFRDAGAGALDELDKFARAVREHPQVIARTVWKVIRDLPQTVVDGFRENGHAIGEGLAVSSDADLQATQNALYGQDVSTAQRLLVTARLTGVLISVSGLNSVGFNVSETTAKAIGRQLDEIAAEKAQAQAIAKIKIDNNVYRDSSLADPGKPVYPATGPWKPAAVLTPAEANLLIEQKLPGNLYILKRESADELNAKVLTNNPDFSPLFVSGTQAVVVVATSQSKFVRVYSPTGSRSYQEREWVIPASEIEGLTPEQIASKYALPQAPTHITDVTVPAGYQLQATIANDINIFPKVSIGGNGGGGGIGTGNRETSLHRQVI